MIKRYFTMPDAEDESVFFFGARQTGKTTLLKQLFPNARYYDESLGKMRMPAPGSKFTLLVGFSSDPNELQEVEMTY